MSCACVLVCFLVRRRSDVFDDPIEAHHSAGRPGFVAACTRVVVSKILFSVHVGWTTASAATKARRAALDDAPAFILD